MNTNLPIIETNEYVANSRREEENKFRIPKDQELPKEKPPMFENQCSTICWLNSMIQIILLTIKDCPQNSNLKRMIESYQIGRNLQSCQGLRRVLSQAMFTLQRGQQDSFDFFQALAQFPEIEKQSVLQAISIYFKNVMCCNFNQNHKSSAYQQDPEYYVCVSIPRNNTSLQDAIENEFQEGTIINDWKCSICKRNGGMKRKLINDNQVPEFILVKLARGEIAENGRAFKNIKDIIPPLGFTVKSEQDTVYAYSLCGVLTHIGRNLNSGHYISEVRKGTMWWKYNDDNITETTFENLSKQGYGFLFQKM